MEQITDLGLRALNGPNQIFFEWRAYLQFCQLYFKEFGPERPVVVEIGTQNGHQKAHYNKFLDADHIGIDISDKFSAPDIIGDSHAPETMAELKRRLGGRVINLLFIDAFHSYGDAKKEYEDYGPLTQDIIALHDIRHERGIEKLWLEIMETERGNPNLTFQAIGYWKHGWCELGIGIIVKKNKIALGSVLDEYGKLPQA